ncbi:MAG: coproporphyrinogen III oxidase family protein [Coriobacteriia bacterium]|nr:coproporphyrinogen III oxidase family protein [Coriobacteriia bacterium]
MSAEESRRSRDPFGAVGSAGGVSLYVHVPFCASRCAYCDFFSIPLPGRPPGQGPRPAGADGMLADPVGEFLAASRMDGFLGEVLQDVPTLYVGGGTPTVLGERLVELLSETCAHVGLRPGAEITVEANPDSLTPALAEALAAAGVSRVSLGVQSFDDDVLAALGRRHDARRAEEAAAAVAGSGLRLSVDLMCGVPRQSASGWRESLERALDSGAGHVSVYPLSVEPGSALAESVRRGELREPDQDSTAGMMLAAEEVLGEGGLVRYEVANYSLPGEESRHNLRYWTGGEYAGVGPRAHSMMSPATLARVGVLGELALERLGVDADDGGRVRLMADASLEEFVRERWDGRPAEVEYLAPGDAAREDVMLGLRLAEGVTDALVELAGADVRAALERLEAAGLVERWASEAGAPASDAQRTEPPGTKRASRWRTTRRGWLLGNEVFGAVWNARGA